MCAAEWLFYSLFPEFCGIQAIVKRQKLVYRESTRLLLLFTFYSGSTQNCGHAHHSEASAPQTTVKRKVECSEDGQAKVTKRI